MAVLHVITRSGERCVSMNEGQSVREALDSTGLRVRAACGACVVRWLSATARSAWITRPAPLSGTAFRRVICMAPHAALPELEQLRLGRCHRRAARLRPAEAVRPFCPAYRRAGYALLPDNPCTSLSGSYNKAGQSGLLARLRERLYRTPAPEPHPGDF